MEDQGLAVQTWQRDDRTNAISSPEIEGNNLVLGHAMKPAVWTKAQAPWLLKPRTIIWYEDPDEMPIGAGIFSVPSAPNAKRAEMGRHAAAGYIRPPCRAAAQTP
jgi:hypothetical protein